MAGTACASQEVCKGCVEPYVRMNNSQGSARWPRRRVGEGGNGGWSCVASMWGMHPFACCIR